jgi:hypothetical protein
MGGHPPVPPIPESPMSTLRTNMMADLKRCNYADRSWPSPRRERPWLDYSPL